MRAGNGIVAQLDETWIEKNRFLRLRERRLQFGKLRVSRQRFGGAGDSLAPSPEFGIDRPIIIQNSGGLLRFALAGGSAGGLNHTLGHAEIERLIAGGEIKAEAAEQVCLVIMLLETEADRNSIGADNRIFQLESGNMALKRRL